MTQTLSLVIYMAILTWLSVMAAALIRTRGWTPRTSDILVFSQFPSTVPVSSVAPVAR